MKIPDSSIKRVPVVEDETAICELCRRILTVEGFEVDIATDGKVAQGMIEKQKYDLFLFDIRLPKLDGKELYQWLQEKHPGLAGRVIFTTGSVIGQDTRIFIEQTARPFLLKPFAPDELRTVVREALR